MGRVALAVDARDAGANNLRPRGANGDLLSDPARRLTRRGADFSSSQGAFFAQSEFLRTDTLYRPWAIEAI